VTWNNQPPINQSIRGRPVRILPGWNELDITPVAQAWRNGMGGNFGVMLRTRENSQDVVGFDIQRHETLPVLELFFKESDPRCSEGCFSDIYPVGEQIGYSHWKESCGHTLYTFFVQNLGTSDVEVFVQISPDRHAVVDENALYPVMARQTEAIVPQKFAFFTRLAFRTAEPHVKSAVKVWFQPVVNLDCT